MKVQEYYFTLACLFMDRIWMYLVCHQLFKQPTLKVVNKTEFHAHSYAEYSVKGRWDNTQHKTGQSVSPLPRL